MVLTRRYNFWLIFACLSATAAFLSYQYIDKVFSFVNLSITVDREQVLTQAKQLATELNWDIKDYHDVTSFDSEDDLQCFVELEAGGKDAFVEMFQSGYYYPYHWHVRFFQEKHVVEMHTWFSPQGKKLGFAQKLAEQAPGAALTKEEALELIEKSIRDWCPDFESYKLIEYDSENRDTGRIDHSFTYERTDLVIGKGFYRFDAVVCGDVITKFEPSVKVPDNFIRRYQQMRSANTLLASVGSFFFRSLYIFLFALFGLFFFYRRSYLLIKSSALASFLVAGGMFLRGLNDFPLWWSSYNTVQSSSTFVLMKIFEQSLTFFYLFTMIFVTLVVAEAAGRFIYKHHVQFFQTCSIHGLGSYEVLLQLFFGYLATPFFFLYTLIFSYVMKTYCGWWSPAGSLFDPNVVASYFPWFGALAVSLYAGFFEEVVCRALPLAMTAVLTRKSKYKNFWFIVIFVVQALIFGAVHANYPNQPFYARLVELIPMSFAFGWMYLKFGLLPGIIIHFIYDAILFSMPIFTSNLLWSKIMVIVLTGLPLWVALIVFVMNKKLYNLPAQYFNQAFSVAEPTPVLIQPRRIGEAIPALHKKIAVGLGLLGFLAWMSLYKFESDVYPLCVTKTQAIEIARQTIADKFGADLDANWTIMAVAQDDGNSKASRFIWQKYGKEAYDFMQGSYLYGINWVVGCMQFSGAVEDRGEEYQVIISSSHLDKHVDRKPLSEHAGHVIRASHKLPEHFAGADIDQDQAEKIAYDFIAQEYNLDRQDLNMISVNNDKFDNRRDWTIVVQDAKVFDFGDGGQARIKVKISGDVVTSFSRFVFVPEDWDRAEQERLINLNLFKSILFFLLIGLTAFGCMFAIRWLSVSQCGAVILQHKALFLAITSCIYAFNSLPTVIASFSTAEPFYDQLTRFSLALVSKLSWQVLFCSVLLSVGAVGFIRARQSNLVQAILLSIAVAFMVLGASSVINFYQPYLEPTVGDCSSAGHWISFLAFAGSCLKRLSFVLSFMIAMFVVLKTVRKLLPTSLLPQLATSILFFIALESMQLGSSISWMLLHAVVVGTVVFVAYYLVLQHDMTLLPLVSGVFMICMVIPEIIDPAYCGSAFDGLIAIVLIIASSLFFYERSHVE
ncbi:CPBP family intramembrane metalloprotease [Candidatus Babeliales bacterium]|nr:CPBP family intramembrane metalloprotease [Candidatus Babeliales bacterium]MBP9844199.1 CPBP family intramembrane metalloprotease [Candidatus Babeliales bacterium]